MNYSWVNFLLLTSADLAQAVLTRTQLAEFAEFEIRFKLPRAREAKPRSSQPFLACTMFIPSDMPHGLAALDGSSTAIASVLCSWPLSGQYGPGARTLYYVLVVICILAPHIEWMRGACLAAALLFPAVAAIHALVLASVSETGGMRDTLVDVLRASLLKPLLLSQVLSI